jgi:hypothetical protein
MIKNLWKKFVNWLFSWQKKEPVILEDEEKYLEEEKARADWAESFKETVEPKKIQCNTHSRFKKSCPICVEAAK